MDKSPDAFRTISEVSEVLETPAHVLRFWESRFPQIRPVKRAGGRRYYRPADVALLTGIKRLLHDEGLTIRGVQKILREQGVRHVAGLSGDAVLDSAEDAEAALEAALAANFPSEADDAPPPQEQIETAQIVALETALRRSPVRPVRPVQENLFAGLFDAEPPAEAAGDSVSADSVPTDSVPTDSVPTDSLTSDRPADPPPLDPDPIEEPEIFAEVTEAFALIEAEEAAEHPAPQDPEFTLEPEPADDIAGLVAAAVVAPTLAALTARITALPAAALRPQRARLRVLRDRLLTLEDRLTAPPY